STTRKVDVRIVSATNANLKKAIAAGKFREDLYFRLNVIELYVPPLSERPDDVLPLAERFIAEHGDGNATLSAEARAALVAYDCPGNVRELQNRIQRASLVSKGTAIAPEDLGLAESHAPAPAAGVEADPDPEREVIEETLVRARGVVSKAAAELGLSRQALYRRMERLGIVMERRPKQRVLA